MSNRSHVYAFAALLLLAAVVMVGCGGDSQSTVFQNVSERVSWTLGRIAFASFGGNGLPRRFRSLRRRQELLDLLRAEDLGDPLPQGLAPQQFRQVLLKHAFKLQVAEKDLQRNQMPGDTGRRQVLFVEPTGIIGKIAY